MIDYMCDTGFLTIVSFAGGYAMGGISVLVVVWLWSNEK